VSLLDRDTKIKLFPQSTAIQLIASSLCPVNHVEILHSIIGSKCSSPLIRVCTFYPVTGLCRGLYGPIGVSTVADGLPDSPNSSNICCVTSSNSCSL